MEQASSRRRNPKITFTTNSLQNFHNSESKYLLALHSCSKSFGIAIKDTQNPEKIIESKIFNIGRSLSNKLFSCMETILPRKFWKQISRISVAKGPGSFTSTRLTISMARIIAQQIDCSLDSISSFHLMAPRLSKFISKKQILNPFWIKDILPRRGIVAGQYQLIKIHQDSNFHEFHELVVPQLISDKRLINPSIEASDNIEEDMIELIKYSQHNHNTEVKSDWQKTLPIYPTSPIDNKN